MKIYVEHIKDNALVNDILDTIEKNNGDVCQIGLHVAEKYTITQEDYEKLWKAAQDIFDDSFEGDSYTLKDEVKQQYAKILADIISNKKYKNTIVAQW